MPGLEAQDLTSLSGGYSGGEPPVPIPNTEVKPASADGTWGAIPWESRSPPGIYVEGPPTTVGGPSFSPKGRHVEQSPGPTSAQERDDKRRRDTHDTGQRREHRTVTSVSSGQLPKWVRDEILRSTPKDRRDPALNHLAKALNQFADERYGAALPELAQGEEPGTSIVDGSGDARALRLSHRASGRRRCASCAPSDVSPGT